jgi:hypothetical protein
MFQHLIKLHTVAQFEIVQLAAQRLPLTNRVQVLAQLFRVCPNTIRTTLTWQPCSPCGNPGTPQLLPDHYLLYVEARTLAYRSKTNHELGRELVAFFPDLGKCSEQTVGRYRRKTVIPFNMSDRHKQFIQNCEDPNNWVGVIDLKLEWREKRKRYTHNFWIWRWIEAISVHRFWILLYR